MNIKYIVTGGAGFIGSNIVRALNARGETDILVVDHLGLGEKWKNLVGLRFEDYIDKSDFLPLIEKGILKNVAVVYHLGACSATTEKDAGYLVENNYRFSRHLCEACLRHGVRFVYASSAATYGNGELGYSDLDADLLQYRPLNMYGLSKHMMDLWALKHGHLDRVAGIKYFNVYGPGEAHKADMRSVVHKSYCQIVESGSVKLFKSCRPEYKDGEQVRDFVYVFDAVDQTLWLGDHPEVSGLFNCGTGTPRTWLDLVSSVFRAMGLETNIDFVDLPNHLKGKYQYHTQADLSKLRSAGYDKPYKSIEYGVHDYVKNYLMRDS